MMAKERFLVFAIDEHRYALPHECVVRVVRAVEITPLPNAPEIVLGVVNVAGSVIPIVHLRKRFSLPEREVALTDQIIFAQTPVRTVGLLVDEAQELIEIEEKQKVGGERILARLGHVQGVLKLDDGLILIHDLERCLSLEEECALNDALEASAQ